MRYPLRRTGGSSVCQGNIYVVEVGLRFFSVLRLVRRAQRGSCKLEIGMEVSL